jgi:hypothetical protein
MLSCRRLEAFGAHPASGVVDKRKQPQLEVTNGCRWTGAVDLNVIHIQISCKKLSSLKLVFMDNHRPKTAKIRVFDLSHDTLLGLNDVLLAHNILPLIPL